MPGKWFAAAVIYNEDPADGEVSFLVMDCDSTDPRFKDETQVKFPGGTDDGHPEDKDVLDTLRREVKEETGLVIPQSLSPLLIYTEQKGPDHFKNFYLIDINFCGGCLRTEFKTENGDRMSPPYWVEINELEGTIFRTHKAAYSKARKEIIGR